MEFYVSINNEKRGPYSIEELRLRNISAETLVMAEGTDQWIPAWQVEILRPLFNQCAPTGFQQPAKEEEPRTGVPYVEARPIDNRRAKNASAPLKERKSGGHSFGGCLLGLLILAIIAVTLVFTCPDTNAHKEAISKVVTESIADMTAKNATGNDLFSQGIRIMGNMLMGKVVDTAVDNMVTVDNYMVCSLGKVHYEGKDHTVSIGLLGHVFTVDKEDITKAAEKYYLDFRRQAEAAAKDQLQENVVDPLKEEIQNSVVEPIKEAVKGALGGLIGDLLSGDSKPESEN
ncbi:MAG: DUF4339 domain-containing protein [Prevotella sp.]|nr:DUF4339 domain-containing protein [Prevotella sp.]